MRVDISALGKTFQPIISVGLGCVDRPAICWRYGSFVSPNGTRDGYLIHGTIRRTKGGGSMLFIFHDGMDFLKGKLLLHLGSEPILAESKIHDGTLVLYYFTSMNCDRCTLFDKKLEEVYSQALIKRMKILIIVVPTDDGGDNDKVLNNYPEWYILPCNDLRWLVSF